LQPGCPVSGYHFTVFNRWGQEVFSSDFRDKGWDGYFKGEPADLGVYYYNMEAYIGDNLKKITTSGNVTLVR
jgi:gliding motility-associated-like protein